jgi:predicted esterase
MPTNHHISIPKTAHYSTLGTAGKHIKHLWMVCHGYGQLASRFINKFTEVMDDETFVIAPEGLSRFYFGSDFTGEVAASWMTKGDRWHEINDHCNWLDIIYDKYVPQMSDQVQITILGFSQGVATVFRWAQSRTRACDNLIAWAGRIPEDVSYKAVQEYVDTKKIYFVYGLQDEFLTEKRVIFFRTEMKELGLNVEEITFDDKHVVDRPTLKLLGEKIKGQQQAAQ